MDSKRALEELLKRVIEQQEAARKAGEQAKKEAEKKAPGAPAPGA